MAYVITRLCRDCVDTSCVSVCPVDCIYRATGGDGWPNQLFIHPDECIDCGACEPECPWQAIYEEVTTPAIFKDDITLNSSIRKHAHEFVVAQSEPKSHPSPEQVEANKRLWGVARAAS